MGAHRGGRKHAKRSNPSPAPTDLKKQKQQGRQRSAPPSPMPTESDSISSDSFVSSSASSQSSRSTSPTPPPQTIQKERIPPIIVEPTHWASVAPMIMPSFTQDKLTAKFSQNNIKLQAVDTTTFRSVQAVLENANIPFHTFSLPAERQLKVLLRGVPSYNTEDTVKSELESLGYTISHVRQFLKDGRKLPMYMVCLPNTQLSKNIFNLSSLFYLIIRVEAYKTSGPSQCFSCQGFGHSSTNCKHQPKCVKCGNDHATKTCTKTPDQPPKCCNCNGEHTANYRHCPAYIKATSAKKSKPHDITPPPATQPTSILTTSPTQLTYSQALSLPKSQLAPPIQPLSEINTNLIDILNHAIYQISTASSFKDSILTAISAIVSLINQDGRTT